MLSRTADHLFWMARYTERAENTARMLDVHTQMSLLPRPEREEQEAWRSLLGISELEPQFLARQDKPTREAVLNFMARDATNGSSIWSCLQAARENARAVRGTLTTEVWETQNTTWLELQRHLAQGFLEDSPSDFFEWVKYRSHLSRGVMIGTMIKDEAFHFARLGAFLERADNTARLLGVKFFERERLEREPGIGAERRDFYHWAAVLRSVSAFEVYRKVYRDVITPGRVAELLILRPDMPRSLLASVNELVQNLEAVRNDASKETERRAGILRAELHYGRIDDILARGLRTFLVDFLERINDLGARISRDFLVPLAPER